VKPDYSDAVSAGDLRRLHDDFKRVYENLRGKKMMFARLHFNRVIQSAWIVMNEPALWPRIISDAFRAATGGKKCLRSLEIALTYRCNARCQQCSCRTYIKPELEETGKLTIDEIKNAIDQAVDLGAFQFVLNGGEPLLEKDRVVELTRYIKRKHKGYVHLCTNGFLLDDEMIDRLSEEKIDSIEMGLDSSEETLHDGNRIPGSFKKIERIVYLCRKKRIKIVLNTILTNARVDTDELIRTVFLAMKWRCLLQITPCCLTGAFSDRMDLLLSEKSKLYFHWLLALSWNNRSDLYSSLTSIKCPAAREKIGLQPYGDVVSCPLIQITYGNIRERSLEDIRNEMLKDPYYTMRDSEGCLPAMSESFIRERLLGRRRDVTLASGEEQKK